MVEGIIDRRRAAGLTGDDLLLLLRARDPDAVDADALDDTEIRDQVLIFLLAGHETTATTLMFALHLLGRHPEVQQRVRVEAQQVLGADDRLPTAEQIAALTYTTQVIKEAMRLYPPVYGMGRQIPDGDVIDGYCIPPGADVLVSPWSPTTIHEYGKHRNASIPTALPQQRKRIATVTHICPLVAAQEPASVSISPCSRRPWQLRASSAPSTCGLHRVQYRSPSPLPCALPDRYH